MLLPSYSTGLKEAGLDEAGRGCLAGPVVAAAVIFPEGFSHPLLNDSKKMEKAQRNELKMLIKEEALAHAIGICSPEEIDTLNILWASIKAMHKAVEQLQISPEHLLVDGNRFKPYMGIPHTCIVKGDGKYQNIAAASILAKTYRDELMEKYAEEFPFYAWERNAGYPTKAHREGIRQHGASPLHRKTFRLLKD
ncbi:ribonuclease HII [Marinilongibacter aquaticus]|uniref:ribonuclease HII n=1 Tax=Marinilongibacter aquaticus TaxID=2975157 RepID=UPI0021BDE0D6|nr:ribonuclease HII [Marinilongibacter aquaticus]UBM59722.1 ribonuclease HII [Marinilongibacter aquaticus]